jgi:hypothetical protein
MFVYFWIVTNLIFHEISFLMVDSYAFDSQSAKVVAGYVMQTKEEKLILICAMVVANHVNWRCL